MSESRPAESALEASSPSEKPRSTTPLEELLREGAATWYPEFAGHSVDVLHLRSTLRVVTQLHFFRLRAAGNARDVVVKVALREPVRKFDRRGAADEAANLVEPWHEMEYRALRKMEATFGESSGDERFRAVPVLDLLVEQRAIVLEHVPWKTLLDGGRHGPDTREEIDVAFERTGAWLRRFHALAPFQEERHELTTRDEFVESILSTWERLEKASRRAGSIGALRSVVEARAHEVLPESFPLVLSHGDFGPQNVFVDESERVAVIDTLGRTLLPACYDLAWFLFVLRSRGLAPWPTSGASKTSVERRADRFLGGYFDGAEVPRVELDLFLLRLTLDKWASGLDSRDRAAGIWRLAKSLRMRRRERCLASRVRLLLEGLAAAESGPLERGGPA